MIQTNKNVRYFKHGRPKDYRKGEKKIFKFNLDLSRLTIVYIVYNSTYIMYYT